MVECVEKCLHKCLSVSKSLRINLLAIFPRGDLSLICESTCKGMY